MEPIKQEIINNIFENGDKQITGPILQTVLIDMIDDVNVKDQEILSKTGSWDDAATQIPNLATKEEVTNLSESIARDLENVVDVDLTGYATEQWVQDQGYLKEHQDISNLATKTELIEAENNLQGNITSLSESVARDIANVSVPEGVATEQWVQSQDYASKSYVDNAVSSSSVDLTGYATETWVENQGYLTEHQDISGLATKTELNGTKDNLQGNITSLSESVARDLANVDVDLTGYATETWVQSQGYLTEHQDISGLATKSELTSVSESVQTDITNLSESVANSAVWKKGTGTDSIVQVFSEDLESESTATELGAVAIGALNTASGVASHAEGIYTVASGQASHAEGNYTTASEESSHAEGYKASATGRYGHAEGWETEASGIASHAEGIGTITHNVAEHAQGILNDSPENQIFSVGAGDGDPEYPETATRRNAISVLAVDNNGSYTASFFVQNIGGYDGTNPLPGTNDLATVINSLPSGGSSETLWEKGTGEDSLVQKLTGANETNTPTATGTGAIAIGSQTTASGLYSYAEGDHTVASGTCSHAEGNSTKAEGFNSHAKGYGTKASGMYSNAEGYNAIASGDASHAEGESAEASGWGSHAEGSNTLASGSHSHAEGSSTNASGSYSHAEGTYATASGYYSHAEGDNTKAEGESSHAEGYKATATGRYGHAEGDTSNASGLASHAEGQSTLSSGQSSHAEGFFTVASNDYEHAQGQYNHNSTNQIFSVGAGEKIGETVTRRNAVSILEVPNSDTQVVTASFFVQNIGGYDGTNPEPGTNDLATVINGLSSSGGSSETLWEKGTGKDSLVQVVTEDRGKPRATGVGAIAIGYGTHAAGNYSHAEGYSGAASESYSHTEGYATNAHGQCSHAEGYWSVTEGTASHAEGFNTVTSNDYEHAQGTYNHNSANQIFSIGVGEKIGQTVTRRNAISVLSVPNSETQINTASFFVQNVGGYDGTNPTPGTNDLATVINGMSTGGGSSETLWKKGTGTDSVVQILTGNNEAYTSVASGTGAIAIGALTTASAMYSHAEGSQTNASGIAGHAEGSFTNASGFASHAEGKFTIASNESEHAQGRYNHNSENQIFSIGTGNSDTDRRNAVSVLEVSNTGSYTASVFIQNVGGYDGTNPLPGTNDLATVISGLSSGGSSETLWKKGTGTDSIVQKLSGDYEAYTSTATGIGAVAIGTGNVASGEGSHAEGDSTTASSYGSHAEGQATAASGMYSHAEGTGTIAANRYEHAQGMFNHSSENQIFSIGVGKGEPYDLETAKRRNAISILVVPGNNQINTGSVFVQNVGGYDGTNPIPGTNDLATVINGMSSSGGTGTSTETWTFTLDDGSTVTKNIVIG